MVRSFSGGQLVIISHAHAEGFPLRARVCAAAARGGHLHLLQWLRAHDCAWDYFTCAWAARGGHLEVTKMIRRIFVYFLPFEDLAH